MTQKNEIYNAIKNHGTWLSGYMIEKMAFEIGCKPSTASRRVRELVESGSVEKRMNGRFVEYRYCGTNILIPKSQKEKFEKVIPPEQNKLFDINPTYY